MEEADNYTTLQDFSEDISLRRPKSPFIRSRNSKMKMWVECYKGQTALIVLAILVASVCANIVLGILLYNNRTSLSAAVQPKSEETHLTGELKLNSLRVRYDRLCQDYTALSASCSKTVRTCKPCPEGWLHMEDDCFYFSPDKMNWEQSKDSCDSMGSHLAILLTHKQHDMLEKEAKKIGSFDYHFWIGLSDQETEGVWKWVDDSPVNNTYWDAWHSEPNNHQSGGIHGEDCAVLSSHSKSWFDVPCDHIYKHICQMDAFGVDGINNQKLQ
uniref:C-type lectin domain-containing protein n=1 Tax=Denticeps clupeoides TaxID=299321 RepID=A0AAY3ZYX9_9TELE